MRRIVIVLGVVLSMCAMSRVLLAADSAAKSDADATKAKAAAKAQPAVPADRVVIMYFHRTQRCPTCRRMGSYSEEAVLKGFTKQIKQRKIEFYSVDFQDEANADVTNGYQVAGPTLIVAQVVGNKVKHYKNLTEIWTKNGDKDEFLKYVRDNVADYQKSMPKTAMKQKAEETSSKTK